MRTPDPAVFRHAGRREEEIRMKLAIISALMVSLAACAGSPGRNIEKAEVSKDATGVMLTNTPVDRVAQCLGAAYRTTAQPIAGGYLVPGETGASYRVIAFADPLSRYATRVDILAGQGDDAKAAACILAEPDAAGTPPVAKPN